MSKIEKSINVDFSVSAIHTTEVGNLKNNPELVNWNSNKEHPLRNWNYHRIWAMVKGSGNVETTFGRFTLKEGLIYYIPGSTIIRSYCKNYMCQHYIDFIPTKNKFEFENFIEFNHTSDKFDEINALISRAEDHYTKNDESSDFIVNSCITTILSYFAVRRITPNKYAQTLQPSLEYINNNLQNPDKIKIEKLSHDMSYSTKHYTRLFKSAYGVTPSEYILNKRLEYAQFLLVNSNDYINNIVRRCGFTDALYFSRIFHKKFGISPSAFRNKQ